MPVQEALVGHPHCTLEEVDIKEMEGLAQGHKASIAKGRSHLGATWEKSQLKSTNIKLKTGEACH